MKSFRLILLVSLFFVSATFAQVPQGFTYQSVLRDSSGNALANLSNLPVRFKIFNGADSIYIETHTASTNEFGILTRTVGQGIPVSGNFSSINWGSGTFSLKVEINFGTGYEHMGTNQIFTVPFAMIARNIASDVPGNLFVGYDAGKSNTFVNDTAGNANTFIGSLAGFSNTIGAFNVVVGREAFYTSATSDENTAVGGRALFSNTVGDANTAIGRSALYNNTNGNSNTANGVRALYSNTTGDANTAMGRSALSNTNGSNNSAFGRSALFANTIGYSNVAIGIRSLYNNTANNNLVAIGDSALLNNGTGVSNILTQGYGNTAIGSKSLYANTTGTRNTGLGYRSGDSYANGSACTYLGYNADASAAGLFNASAIGCDAVVAASNNMIFGNSSVVGWGFGTNPAGVAIRVGTGPTNGNGATLSLAGVWTAGSAKSIKEDFTQLNASEILDKIEQMEVTRWKYIGTKNEYHIGPMAEDFYRNFNVGDDKHISDMDKTGVLFLGMQALYDKNKQQGEKINTLLNEIELLKNAISLQQSDGASLQTK